MVEKNQRIFDYQITFFVGSGITTRNVSEVIKNRDNRLFLNSLGLPDSFSPPFNLDDRTGEVILNMRSESGEEYKAFILGNPCDYRVVKSGDYISFIDENEENTINVLLISFEHIDLEYKKCLIPKKSTIFIGRTGINEISCNFSDYLSREKHAVISVDSNGIATISDIKQTIGLYVNGKSVDSAELNIGDEIFIMGLSIVFMGEYIAINNLKTDSTLKKANVLQYKNIVENDDQENYFVSTPRILKSITADVVEVDGPPSPPSIDNTPAILVYGPSLTMAVVMLASLSMSISSAITGGNTGALVASSTMAAGMLAGSLLWPILLRRYQKKVYEKENKHRIKRYSEYIRDIENELEVKSDFSKQLMDDSLSPSPDMLCALLDDESNRLKFWERSYEDADFLDVRLGKGEKKFDIDLKIPRQGFQLYEDELRELPVGLKKKYDTLYDVPLTLDIQNNRTIGIIGDVENIRTLIEEIVLNIISLHPYNEVKLVLVLSPEYREYFDIFKNAPHVWSNDKKVRFYATTPDEVHYIFNVIDEEMIEREAEDNKEKPKIPHYVIIADDASLVGKEALGRYMNDAENTVGLTTIFAYGEITKLPKSCKTIIQSYDTRTGYYSKNKNENKFIPFVPDSVKQENLKRFMGNLSKMKIKRDQRSLGIADRISFLQMYKAGNVGDLKIEEHWSSNNSEKSLAAPVGVIAGGEVFSLDLHESYHGCHGLVAGTTGSGKSEFLQAFVLSLAINYSPKEIAFVLVDFKGGDMARPFMAKNSSPALPHLSATISNLSGNILYRALVSLEAEIKSRQRLFNNAAEELGIDKLDINSYHKYYKNGRLNTPLPHLVIIIDEFAQLKTQQPEFLAQLINVAQVGRSLGIHLILATQKPSGIVDPQIMSNSRFKVCLKVADKQDSVDMINKPDSAMIKNPGRLHLQVGYNEIYECIQSGFSGADYLPAERYVSEDEITIQMTDNTANPIHSAKLDIFSGKTGKTQLEAVVAEIVKLGVKKNLSVKPLWLDVLPEMITLDEIDFREKSICSTTIGLVDYVKTQEQKPLTHNFPKNGHIGLYGASGTGKTTLIQTLVYSMVCDYAYTPEQLNIYALDFGGRNLGYLENLPHTGGVVFADDQTGLNSLIEVLREQINERKLLFAEKKCGTFTDYCAVSSEPLPAIIVIIDNYSSFRDRYMDESDEMNEIIAAGKTFGVYFVITGNTRNGIYYKVTEHISAYFMLRMNDPNNYLDILNKRPPVTPEDICGRGITVIDNDVVEFQAALAFPGDNEADRLSAICEIYEHIKERWKGRMPVNIRYDYRDNKRDEAVSFSGISEKESKNDRQPQPVANDEDSLVIAYSKSGNLKYGINLNEENKICICYDEKAEFNAAIENICKNIAAFEERRIVIVSDTFAEPDAANDIIYQFEHIRGVDGFERFMEELKPELNERLENDENCESRIFIIIPDITVFFDMLTDEQAEFMRKIFKYMNEPKYGIYFVTGYKSEDEKSNDRIFMELVVNAHNYLICSNCYTKILLKIETIPAISNMKTEESYICLNERFAQARW